MPRGLLQRADGPNQRLLLRGPDAGDSGRDHRQVRGGREARAGLLCGPALVGAQGRRPGAERPLALRWLGRQTTYPPEPAQARGGARRMSDDAADFRAALVAAGQPWSRWGVRVTGAGVVALL